MTTWIPVNDANSNALLTEAGAPLLTENGLIITVFDIWSNISDGQSPGWTPVGDTQSPGWATVNT